MMTHTPIYIPISSGPLAPNLVGDYLEKMAESGDREAKAAFKEYIGDPLTKLEILGLCIGVPVVIWLGMLVILSIVDIGSDGVWGGDCPRYDYSCAIGKEYLDGTVEILKNIWGFIT